MDPRPATAADLPAIREVVTAAYARYLSRMDRPPAPMLADYGAAVDAGELWVTGQPVAGLIELTEDGDALHVGNVAVHPGSQGTGLGRLLMDFAERRAILLGHTRLSLYTNEVMTENQAIYTHLGYREVGRHADDGYRRVYMEKLLASRP
ncbi:MAG TPA: GNAT family N-acetyltransferase [Streptosporangiaceae bacterium]|jgi:GNAT superfamily N-acetyltransferase